MSLKTEYQNPSDFSEQLTRSQITAVPVSAVLKLVLGPVCCAELQKVCGGVSHTTLTQSADYQSSCKKSSSIISFWFRVRTKADVINR